MADERRQSEGPTTKIRLYLRASNLAKSMVGQQPDTLARISLLPAPSKRGAQSHLPPAVPPPGVGVRDAEVDAGADEAVVEGVLDETEVVYKCSNPKWTTSFSVDYEYGSQLLVFVDIFAVAPLRTSLNSVLGSTVGNSVQQRGMKLLGRAAFDVQDILGSRNHIKARRLRHGGVVYAHAEPHCCAPPSRSPSAARRADRRVLRLRLRAAALVHTRSVRSRVAPRRTAKPDTYYEVSRPSSSTGTWIVAYRSPTVTESVAPAWDEAAIDVGALRPASSSAPPSEDLSEFRVTITVYKVKKRKCKEIGSCQTTLVNLVATGAGMAQIAGHGREHSSDEEEGDNNVTFQLRATEKGGATPSDEITGMLTVVHAAVENSREVSERSRKFLSAADDDDEVEGGACPMHDEESVAGVDAEAVVHFSPPRPKFSDYVAAGLDIDFCVAIDFTSSNGDPRVPGTQHFSRDGMMNDYEEAIVTVGSKIEKYSSSQEYPVWGFGAKYGGQVRHIFQCGNSATAIGTQGMLDAYRTVFETDLVMSGPTEIHAVLRAAAARSKKFYNAPSSLQYCVLMILTDGIVNDLHSTQELIRSYRTLQLPLSVVVVGIGRADFAEFHRWSDAPPDVRGRCKFVEFRKHQFDPDSLSREVLLNIPHEIIDNLLARNILPSG